VIISWLLAFGYWLLAKKSKGRAEDEYGDNAAKFAKIRPMRVEMYGTNWNGWFGKNLLRSNMYGQLLRLPKPVPTHSIHCSGQRGDFLIGNDMFRPKK